MWLCGIMSTSTEQRMSLTLNTCLHKSHPFSSRANLLCRYCICSIHHSDVYLSQSWHLTSLTSSDLISQCHSVSVRYGHLTCYYHNNGNNCIEYLIRWIFTDYPLQSMTPENLSCLRSPDVQSQPWLAVTAGILDAGCNRKTQFQTLPSYRSLW